MWRCSLVAFSISVACQFERPTDRQPVDAPPTDTAPACAADTITCATDTYVECGPDGFATRTLACPLGCAPDVAKCLDIDPHNGLAMYLDMVEAPPDLLAAGPVVIDTVAGTLRESGATVQLPSFLAPSNIRVFVVNNLRFASTVEVSRSPGAPALAFLAAGAIVIEGAIDVSANTDVAGPGGVGPGEDHDCSPFEFFTASATGVQGLGGAGGYTRGGYGGSASIGNGGTPGDIHPLGAPPFGGCAGFTYYDNGFTTIRGGAGGGGMQLTSRRSVTLTATATLDASGGGGHTTVVNRPGPGGGAGGMLILEAPEVIVDGPLVMLSVKGGGGGGAGTANQRGGTGADGGTDANPAQGGGTLATGSGGMGGLLGGAESGASGLASDHHGGGGGGAAGTVATASGAEAGISSPGPHGF